MKRVIVLGLTALAVLGLVFASFGSRSASPSSMMLKGGEGRMFEDQLANAPSPVVAAAPPAPPAEADGFAAAFDAKEEGRMGKKMALGSIGARGSGVGGYGSGIGGLGLAKPKPDKARAENKPVDLEKSELDTGETSGGEAATRAWFPETFLFEPLIVTDATGRTTVPVKVPDRLTNWRVLALAHSRDGAQAGAVTSFLGTLPTYVEPVTPAFLYAGDEVKLPVQVVNTTSSAVSAALTIIAEGAKSTGGSGAVTVPAAGNTIRYATLTTTTPGNALLKATLGSTDAIERTIPIKPAGTPVTQTRGGTLAAPRTLELEGPTNALTGSETVHLTVYPGALGLLRSELSAAPFRGGAAEDAYLLTLLGRSPALLHTLGAEADAAAVRDLSILATQRAVRYSRNPPVEVATLFAAAALSHPDNPVLMRMGERLATQVAQAQRPDGTCQGATGWTLQRLLVTTAECVRAVSASEKASKTAQQRASAVRIKASGAFERNLARVSDAYTAAQLLASGAVTGSTADKLKEQVLKALATADDGAKYLPVESGVVRADGYAPSTYEATAVAILGLANDPKVPIADLGTYLLGGYSASAGWGDGRTNLIALQAVVSIFKDPVPSSVALSLERDGKVLVEGSFDASKLKQVVSMDANATGSGGKHTWVLKANPAVPGLGYTLSLGAYVPWKDSVGSGMELTVKAPPTFDVGKASDLELTAGIPAGIMTMVKVPLPAGVQLDREALQKQIGVTLARYESEDGLVTLHLNPVTAGAVASVSLRVIPTLGGSLQAPPIVIGQEGRTDRNRAFAPRTWVIR